MSIRYHHSNHYPTAENLAQLLVLIRDTHFATYYPQSAMPWNSLKDGNMMEELGLANAPSQRYQTRAAVRIVPLIREVYSCEVMA
jgi:hypothetical protein